MLSQYNATASECLIPSSAEESTDTDTRAPENPLDASTTRNQRIADTSTAPLRRSPIPNPDDDYEMSNDADEFSQTPHFSRDHDLFDDIQSLFNQCYSTPEEDRMKEKEKLVSAFDMLDSVIPTYPQVKTAVSLDFTELPTLYSDFNAPYIAARPQFSRFMPQPRSPLGKRSFDNMNIDATPSAKIKDIHHLTSEKSTKKKVDPSMIISARDPQLLDCVMASLNIRRRDGAKREMAVDRRQNMTGRKRKRVRFLDPEGMSDCEEGVDTDLESALGRMPPRRRLEYDEFRHPNEAVGVASGRSSLTQRDITMDDDAEMDKSEAEGRDKVMFTVGSSGRSKLNNSKSHASVTWRDMTAQELSKFCEQSRRASDGRYVCTGFAGACENKHYGANNVFKRHLIANHSNTVFYCDAKDCSFSSSRDDVVKRHKALVDHSKIKGISH